MGQAVDGMPKRVEELEVEKILGKGFFGEVHKAKALMGPSQGQVFALKKVKLSVILENRIEEQLRREINILYSLQHPRIVKLFFDFKDSSCVYLGMEFASGGSVFDRLSKLKKLPAELASRYFFETCQALDYLHHLPEKVIHRDIKPENLLLDGDDCIKLADFGWANLMPGNVRDTFCGTLDYLAPEMITAAGHDESVDMWMMGVLLFEMLKGSAPFGSKSKETTCRLILNVDLKFAEDFDSDAKDLIIAICKKKPRERLQVRGAIAHAFVARFLPKEEDVVHEKAVAPEADVLEQERPSVILQHVLEDTTKISDDMQILLQAKQQTEEMLMKATAELEDTHFALQREQKEHAKLQAEVADLETDQSLRERDLEEMRRQAEALEAELAKLNRGGRLSFPFRFGGRLSSGAGNG